MKIYTYSQAREKLADILEESKSEEIVFLYFERPRKLTGRACDPKRPLA